MTGAFVAAIISMCAAGLGCENKAVRIEHRACGVHFKAQVFIMNRWAPAEAKVTCPR